MHSGAQVFGAEAELTYQLTADDRVALDLSETNAYWVGKHDATFANLTYALSCIPGARPFKANLSYDHSIAMPAGSKLTPHGDVRYQSPHDDTNIGPQLARSYGPLPVHSRRGEVIGDLNASWLAADGRISVTGYARNVGDNRYKTGVTAFPNGATPSDPRTYGVVLTARF